MDKMSGKASNLFALVVSIISVVLLVITGVNAVPINASLPTYPLAGVGLDGVMYPGVVGNDGALTVNNAGTRPTYSASLKDYFGAASSIDVMELCGSSAGKYVRLNKIEVTADTTGTASAQDFWIAKLSSPTLAASGTAVTAVPHNSNNPTSQASILTFATEPSTSGVQVGLLRSNHYALPAATSTGIPVFVWIEDFTSNNNQGVWLNNANECVSLRLEPAAVVSGISIYSTFEWTEQSAVNVPIP
jgi:hypothetical protein